MLAACVVVLTAIASLTSASCGFCRIVDHREALAQHRAHRRDRHHSFTFSLQLRTDHPAIIFRSAWPGSMDSVSGAAPGLGGAVPPSGRLRLRDEATISSAQQYRI